MPYKHQDGLLDDEDVRLMTRVYTLSLALRLRARLRRRAAGELLGAPPTPSAEGLVSEGVRQALHQPWRKLQGEIATTLACVKRRLLQDQVAGLPCEVALLRRRHYCRAVRCLRLGMDDMRRAVGEHVQAVAAWLGAPADEARRRR